MQTIVNGLLFGIGGAVGSIIVQRIARRRRRPEDRPASADPPVRPRPVGADAARGPAR